MTTSNEKMGAPHSNKHTSTYKLKGYFADGQLPTGANFAELIDSMVHRDVFEAHKEEFEQWRKRGEISLGAGDATWQLFVDEARHLRIQRKQNVETEPGTADVHLDGWVGMAGRVGTGSGDKDFAGDVTELNLDALPSVKSDGKWHRVVDAPERPCAFEITAAVAQPPEEAEADGPSRLRTVVGNPKPGNAVIHAIAAANGARGAPPGLRRTAQPETGAGWRILGRRFLALLIILLLAELILDAPFMATAPTSPVADTGVNVTTEAKDAGTPDTTSEEAATGDAIEKGVTTFSALAANWIQEFTGLKGLAGSVSAHPNISTILSLLVLVYFLRTLWFAYRAQRNGIAIRWTRASGSRLLGSAAYTLQVRGPAYDKGDANIHFHITKLWS